MFKKLFILNILLISFNSYSNENKCYIEGSIDLPKLENKYNAVIFNNSTPINDNYFCFPDKINIEKNFYIHVLDQQNNLILKNKFIIKNKKAENHQFNLTINRAVAEEICDENCSIGTIEENINEGFITEYSQKVMDSYYSPMARNFSYSRIQKKIQRQKRDFSVSKQSKNQKQVKTYFFSLDNTTSKKYSNFKYKKSEENKLIENFKSNNILLEGLTSSSIPIDIVVTNWLRYLYYYGDDINKVGSLYSNTLKNELINSESFHEPLILTNIYQVKATSRHIRDKKDEEYYKKTVKKIEGMFEKRNNTIYNKTPDYANITFVFENGSWKLNKFEINDKYIQFINDL